MIWPFKKKLSWVPPARDTKTLVGETWLVRGAYEVSELTVAVVSPSGRYFQINEGYGRWHQFAEWTWIERLKEKAK